MSLQHIILGFLKNYGSLSGYDIKQLIDASTRNFWYCDLSQIYRALNANEESAWVRSTPDPSNKRNRVTYSLTPEGESALQAWLEADFEIPQVRQPELARIFFGRYTPPERLREQFTAYRQHWEALLSTYEAIRVMLETSSEEHADDLSYWLMTLDHGISSAQAHIEWCSRTLQTLSEIETSKGKA